MRAVRRIAADAGALAWGRGAAPPPSGVFRRQGAIDLIQRDPRGVVEEETQIQPLNPWTPEPVRDRRIQKFADFLKDFPAGPTGGERESRD
jgi:hypothetical protein